MTAASSGLAGKLSRPVKLLLGVATLWPLLYFGVFVAVWFTLFLAIAQQAGPSGADGPPGWFLALFPLHCLTILLSIGLLIVYIVDVFKNDRIARDMKALWAVVLFMGGFIAMPVYWYLYFWRDAE